MGRTLTYWAIRYQQASDLNYPLMGYNTLFDKSHIELKFCMASKMKLILLPIDHYFFIMWSEATKECEIHS